MKAARLNFLEKAAFDSDTASEHDEGQWQYGLAGRYRRSYDMLSDAISAIFENIFLPEALMTRDPETGEGRFTDKAMALYESIKNRFTVVMRDDDQRGLLEIEICPVNESGVVQQYIDAADPMRAALTSFITELNEFTAGIPGIHVDPLKQVVTLQGPQPFYEMIKALCEEKNIGTAETVHDAYAGRDDKGDDFARLGHYPYLPQPRKPAYDEDDKTGMNFRRYAGRKDIIADIPESVFRSMEAQPYGYKEIGRLINDYNNKGRYPLLSLRILEAIVQQDLQDKTALKESPAFNLH